MVYVYVSNLYSTPRQLIGALGAPCLTHSQSFRDCLGVVAEHIRRAPSSLVLFLPPLNYHVNSHKSSYHPWHFNQLLPFYQGLRPQCGPGPHTQSKRAHQHHHQHHPSSAVSLALQLCTNISANVGTQKSEPMPISTTHSQPSLSSARAHRVPNAHGKATHEPCGANRGVTTMWR